MAEDASAAAPAGGGDSTVEVPAAAIGAAKEGDTVQFKVVSVDAANGVANLAPVQAGPTEGSGSDDMAAEFNRDKMKE